MTSKTANAITNAAKGIITYLKEHDDYAHEKSNIAYVNVLEESITLFKAISRNYDYNWEHGIIITRVYDMIRNDIEKGLRLSTKDKMMTLSAMVTALQGWILQNQEETVVVPEFDPPSISSAAVDIYEETLTFKVMELELA